jgi:hypothetical protein
LREICFLGGNVTSAAKAGAEKSGYRSGKPLRHPKASATLSKCGIEQAQYRVFPQPGR